jgi:hypothetical protein
MVMRLSVKEIAEFVLQLFRVRFHRPSQAGGIPDPSRSAFPIHKSNGSSDFPIVRPFYARTRKPRILLSLK